MTELKLFLLGAPRVELAGKIVDLNRRKVMAPLIYLTVTRQRQRRDALATLFWPESDQATARASLRRELYTLTSALGSGWLETDRESIALATTAQLWVDVAEFRQHLVACQQHGHTADGLCEACVKHLAAAEVLYQGDFLAGFTLSDCPEFDDWQFFQAESLRRDLAGCLEKLVRWYSDCRAYETAITYARRWLTLDLLHEPVHRALMQLYALAGQQAAAVRQYQECVRILDAELGVEPEAETTQLYELIRSRRLTPASTSSAQSPVMAEPAVAVVRPADSKPAVQSPKPPNNLPTLSTPFIGRTQELAAICQRLTDPACRLLTLIGAGGMGKTRLALEAAKSLVDRAHVDNPPSASAQPHFEDGIYFVPLAAMTSVHEVTAAIAESVGLHFSGAVSPLQQVQEHLQSKRLLLILDNVEQLIGADDEATVLTLLSTLLAGAPSLKLLVTSREALNLQEEWFHQVGGLAFPGEQEAVTQTAGKYDAVRLFDQCARRARATFALAEEEPHVVRICRLVEGMPLALELAAAWLKVLTTENVANEIEHNLDILTARHQNVAERHRSLRVIFEQTWQRLSSDEQLALSKLSLFQGGCTREAAAQVVGVRIDMLADLVDKALLRREEQPLATERNESRFYFHPLLQQYAAEKLAAMPLVLEKTKAAHGAYYLELVEIQCKRLKSAMRKLALTIFDAEFANIRTAWLWAVAAHDLRALARFALPLSHVFENRAPEGLPLYAQAATRIEETTPLAALALGAVLVAQAEQVMRLGYDPTQCVTLAERALTLLQDQDAPREKLKALNLLGNAFWLQGAYGQAKERLEEGLALARTHCVLDELGDFLIRLGLVNRELYSEQAVMTFYQQTLAELRTLGDTVCLAHQLLIYGEYLVMHNQLQEGQRFLAESLLLARAAGGTDFLPFILMHLGMAAHKLDNYVGAEGYFQEILTMPAAEKRIHPLALAHLLLGRVQVAQGRLTAAERHLCQGLQLGWTHKLTLVMTLALVCFAEFYAACQESARAVCLLTLALKHPATEQRDKQAASQQLTLLQAKLTLAEFADAVARGNASTLDTEVAQLLSKA